ncbi:hypothetical protein GCM10009104_13610 [Marinobacterium maritimum]|uniref:Flagellar hook protein FlgE n=1 Tax=Marinobacterium maritimum TaxID=500162 RepID=A0ABP3TAP2_9GAMM
MAGFNTAVTGLKASTTLLDVAGNNIANSSTVGFKASRTEFGDIYATAVVGAGSSNTPGSGVTVTDIAQDFSGGTIEFTNSNLDLAINGSGFFMLDDGQGNITYTRAGAFELDKEGNIVSKNGKYLQGYGLDALGNQLPIQNLGVTDKESPPKATERIGLSFNINDNKDASDLSRVFSKTDPGSYTYSTTVGTFDSLGNEHSIRMYFAEQRPVREVYAFDMAGAAYDSVTPAFTYPSGAQEMELAGLTFGAGSDLEFDLASVEVDINGNAYIPLTADAKAALADANSGDSRIDPDSVFYDNTNGRLVFELHAEYSQYGDPVVTAGGVDLTNQLATQDSERSASEVQSIYLNTGAAVFDPTTGLTQETVINVGGKEIVVPVETSLSGFGELIDGAEQDIKDLNPDIESVEFITDDGEPRIEITWKSETGDQSFIGVSINSGLDAGSGNALFVANSNVTTTTQYAWETSQGDNSFVGAYRTYAFLNDTEQLDLGKMPDPGSNSTSSSEVGPIMINFNSTTGILEKVNGEDVSSSGLAPRITILGADPANPDDSVLDSDVDQLAGVQLDISGSSQFASESIVKSQSQDGYTKGDLIGVSFAETGEMVASYSNGQRANLGLVAVATFENQDGLQPNGNTEWIATLSSGNAIVNPPGTGLNGTLRSAALEQSNVDLSAELVKLIEGQRNFQANSKTLETLNTVTQAILQI